MPELPEVEVVRLGLAGAIPNRRIAEVSVLHPRPVRRHVGGADDFASSLTGRSFGVPRRRGKYLWLPFADGDALMAHLGMSGQFRLDDPGSPLPPQCRVVIAFTDGGTELRFADQRMFGGLWVSAGGADGPTEIAHIAADLFDDSLDLDALSAVITTKRSGIKRVLLNQTVVSGIGNIYADEALWRARLHYDTPANQLSQAEALDLLEAARQVMAAALAEGGTSFDALYVNVNGSVGYFGRSLAAYGRADLPCDRCGQPIVREAFMNRSSYRCPGCQPRPSAVG
ncbi:bifunctional DNA-formamidopyrimidine glycosylase/DNA-(apurinic or apyrimidinic site) lyase [Propionicimonas sp.]|uniref:bifunctional DNA-formamidopyrimidine glycosylase/DNA-(apurinic or apyrimidinic site) lyase n=1 Tax=Propionicimonas sp. TaxID=1955623 RepID=UPI0018088A06|nr:bifunctional DNA-formamidopyrimidine glycosylase/DNA-(apurinic or apyrimidinic site) lyase [Propionicimonas sp.]MBU3976203.1 bifunctional DNA-formamidopyrimidine glycosylase/DNA-(apurinic or apyrimidinic site) lyase [Actinomycetota bacterium]MBA3021015.1 bifunctional DNA-formamidopyrimidine glycosylase/DNA-(apurinic or apyrimidinic site) lyase [Propionicimonas sp.]MBU3985598.1 bifunctional DNA-formamidopyrimidine glycosylase/DNA-(apurinic or apyrimidinic site) lyase [Actinomycetota bacterium]